MFLCDSLDFGLLLYFCLMYSHVRNEKLFKNVTIGMVKTWQYVFSDWTRQQIDAQSHVKYTIPHAQ
jgi:hypothetical protein